MCTTFPFLNHNIIFSKNIFSGPLFLNEIKLDSNHRNSENLFTFNKNILQFIRPAVNSVNNCHNPKWVKLVMRLRLVLSCLREHKFKHFQEFLNHLCNFGYSIKSTTHSFLHGPLFTNERYAPHSTLSIIDCYLLNNTDFILTQALIFGNLPFYLKKQN